MAGPEAARGGVMVCKIVPGSGADGLLKENDVILSLDGVAVAENGTIPFADQERVTDAPGDHAPDGRKGPSEALARRQAAGPGRAPGQAARPGAGPTLWCSASYLVYGGLVFQPLSANYLRVWEGQGPTRSAC